ncbi:MULTISPECIES: AAA family ATPase [Fusobacterium]|nr:MULTISPECIES: ATP-binding protein [Fusobacterium]MDH6456992.1 AAA15 family ATPase/GTPase [Fusobacterium sp. PH5-7]
MLLEFKVGGYYSFKDIQELYLTPYPGTRIKNTKYEDNFSSFKKNRIMKSAIIFGSNASGKTNIILALERIVDIISNGINLPKDFDVNRLNYDSKSVALELSIITNSEDIFNYSIEFNQNNIIYEKLEKNDTVIYKFNNNTLESELNILSQDILKIFSIRSTDIFLKKLKDFNIKEIEVFIEEIKNIKIKRDNILNSEAKEALQHIPQNQKSILEKNRIKVVSLLKLLDYTISDFSFEKIGNLNEEILYQMYILRTAKNIKFYLGNESEGIKKIMNLIYDLLDIYNGKTIIIDELDSSISTQSLIKIFNDFVNVKENINGQLIVTSHNLFLFNNNIFEPQQIYIVNKKEDLTSELYSLAEFNIRSEKENLYHDFLKGKFGGMNG